MLKVVRAYNLEAMSNFPFVFFFVLGGAWFRYIILPSM